MRCLWAGEAYEVIQSLVAGMVAVEVELGLPTVVVQLAGLTLVVTRMDTLMIKMEIW